MMLPPVVLACQSNTTFGRITGERGHGQRMITFALKFLF
jgi:hypothetical protein